MGYRSVVAVLLSLAVAACGTVDRRVDPDDPDEVGGAVLQSQDLRAMADQMARDIIASGVLANSTPEQRASFYITELRNDSSDRIDKELVLRMLRTELSRGLGRRVMVLDRSAEAVEEIRRERAAKRSGAVSANPAMRGSLAGGDYVLKGVIGERRQQRDDLRSVYYNVTFELTDLETGELVWTNDYETKFLSERSVITR